MILRLRLSNSDNYKECTNGFIYSNCNHKSINTNPYTSARLVFNKGSSTEFRRSRTSFPTWRLSLQQHPRLSKGHKKIIHSSTRSTLPIQK